MLSEGHFIQLRGTLKLRGAADKEVCVVKKRNFNPNEIKQLEELVQSIKKKQPLDNGLAENIQSFLAPILQWNKSEGQGLCWHP